MTKLTSDELQLANFGRKIDSNEPVEVAESCRESGRAWSSSKESFWGFVWRFGRKGSIFVLLDSWFVFLSFWPLIIFHLSFAKFEIGCL